MSSPTRIGITGHRTLDPAVEPHLRRAVEVALLELAAGATDVVLVSGLAAGADRLAAEVARGLGWAVQPVVAGSVEAYAAACGMSEAERHALDAACAAHPPLIVSTPADEDAFGQVRYALAEQCDGLLAIWSARHEHRRNGTQEVLLTALPRLRPSPRVEGATRTTASGAPTVDPARTPSRVIVLDADTAGRVEVAERIVSLVTSQAADLAVLEAEADAHKSHHTLLVIAMNAVGPLAVFFAVTPPVLLPHFAHDTEGWHHLAFWFAVIEVICLFLGLLLWIAVGESRKERWIRHRLAAETRVHAVFGSLARGGPLPASLGEQGSNSERYAAVAGLVPESAAVSAQDLLLARYYARVRLDDQIAYFHRQSARRHGRGRWMERVSLVMFACALVGACGHVLIGVVHDSAAGGFAHHLHDFLVDHPFEAAFSFMAVVCPAITAALVSALTQLGYRDDSARFALMRDVLKQVANGPASVDGLTPAHIEKVELFLMAEIFAWFAATKAREVGM